MKKNQNLILSITGIALVLLILFGLTYAYYLTQIQGNSRRKNFFSNKYRKYKCIKWSIFRRSK